MMRTLLLIPILICLAAPLHAQMFEQVYPDFEYAEIREGTHWNGDTFYLCGLNQMLLRTTDAGKTWENRMSGVRDWCFYDIAATEEGLYLLAEPTVFWNGTMPEHQLAALLRYDPWKNSLDLVEIPRLIPTADDDPVSIHDVAAAGGVLFLLQGNDYDRLLLHRSVDDGVTWDEISLPDSVVPWNYREVACFDSLRIAMMARRNGTTWGAIATTDGGKHWSLGPDLTPIESNGMIWLSPHELLAFVHEGPIMYSSNGGAQWSERSYPPVSRFLDAVAVGENRGYVQGGFGKVFRTDDGFRTFVDISNNAAGEYLIAGGLDTLINSGRTCDDIYVTHDGGLSWDFVRKAELLFWDLRMASDTVGVAMVETMYDDGLAYYKTSDGWETMTLVMDQNHPMFHEYYQRCRIYPVTESLWYLVPPLLPEDKWLVHKSTDGGVSWENLLSANALGDIPMKGGITVVDMPDANYFGIILERNLVVTSDRGESWKVKNLLNQSTFSYTMQLRPHASSWMISGDGVFGADTVWRCSSGWDDWVPVLVEPDTVRSSSFFRMVHLTPDGEVYVLAEFRSTLGYLYDWSYIYRSTDDGQSWELYPTCIDVGGGYRVMQDGSSLLFTAPDIYASSNHRTRGGALRRSTDGWKSNTIEDIMYERGGGGAPYAWDKAIYVCDRRSIFRNLTNGINSILSRPVPVSGFMIDTPYPHPIRHDETATIPLRITGAGQALHLTLHDMLGRKLRDLYDGIAVNENPVITWNTGGLVPGMYVIRAQCGTDVAVKPVLVE